MKSNILFSILCLALAFAGCQKEIPELGEPPTQADADFTFSPTSNPNIIEFTAKNKEAVAVWDFGNSTTAEGTVAKGAYPSKGTYKVTLTVFTSGGSISNSKDVVIADDDLSLLSSPIITALTGGINVGSKTWVIDSNNAGHFGVGPDPVGAGGLTPEFYSAQPNDKAGVGLYDDRYTFNLDAFKFDMTPNGSVYVNDLQSSNFPNAVKIDDDYEAPYTDRIGETWSVTTDEETQVMTLSISGDAFIGFYTGTHDYQIVSFGENELMLRYIDADDGALAWYIRLVPEDLDTGGGSGGGGSGGGGSVDSSGYELPMDFETIEPTFDAFGGSIDTVSDNPDTTGINKSTRVLETDHGFETWAGIAVGMKNLFDFSSATTITLKVYAPKTGVIKIKLEDRNNNQVFVERDVNVTKANEWEEITADFSGTAANKYGKLVLFPGWNEANSGVYYLDDIEQK